MSKQKQTPKKLSPRFNTAAREADLREMTGYFKTASLLLHSYALAGHEDNYNWAVENFKKDAKALVLAAREMIEHGSKSSKIAKALRDLPPETWWDSDTIFDTLQQAFKKSPAKKSKKKPPSPRR